MGRRTVLLVVVAALVGATAAGAALTRGDGDAPAASRPTRRGTARIERRTLVDHEDVDGTLGYADGRPVVNQAGGTYTSLPAAGQVVRPGQVLYEVDQRPVHLFRGEVPAWRRLASGVEDGADVRQLEQALVDGGWVAADALEVDEKWTAATTAAVKAWQRAVGLDATGVVELGAVVFAPDAVRITEVQAVLGGPAQPGGEVVATSSTTRVVTVDLDADRQGLVAVGDEVEVELPDGSTTTGRVYGIATVASGGDSGSGSGSGGSGAGGSGGDDGGTSGDGGDDPTIEITIALDDQTAAGSLDGGPVSVGITRDERDGVLAVPVSALLALAEGGYAVEVTGGSSGSGRLVAVRTGLFADGWVEISGRGLEEGMRVVVPA